MLELGAVQPTGEIPPVGALLKKRDDAVLCGALRRAKSSHVTLNLLMGNQIQPSEAGASYGGCSTVSGAVEKR